MAPQTTPLSNEEAIKLLAESQGIDLADLQKASEDKKEAARIARLAAQIAAEKEDERRKLESAKTQYYEALAAGHIIMKCDGKIITKAKDICKAGEANTDALITMAMAARWKLLRNFKGVAGLRDVNTGSCLIREVPCTCGRDHQVEVFITSND